MATLLLVASSISVSSQAAAEPSELVTDRPDFTESAVVVPVGSPQIEAGITWIDSDLVDELSGAEVLVRWTVARRFELRFGLPDYLVVSKESGASGFSDSTIGAKIQLGPIAKSWDLALIAATSLPTGKEELSFNTYVPVVILITGRELGNSWSLGAQAEAAWPEFAEERTMVWGGTVVLGTGLSEKWGTFVELAGFDLNRDEISTLLHHGYTYLLRPHIQLDIHGAIGLTDASPNYLLGAGISIRP